MKTLILYAHLLAACIAIGMVLLQDLASWRSRHRVKTKEEVETMYDNATVVFMALVALWLTGVSLVLIGYVENPLEYFANQKLWAKFSVVIILSVNGIFLYFYSFQKVSGNRTVLQPSALKQKWLDGAGVLSRVSWLFACYLGIARPWNYSVDCISIMLLYLLLVTCAFIVTHEVLSISRSDRTTNVNLGNRVDQDAA